MFVNSSSLLSGSNDESQSTEVHRGLFISRPLSVTGSSQRPSKCLRLSYHLAGDDCLLTVDVLSVDRSLSSVWSQHCGSVDATWRELALSLSDSGPFQVSDYSLILLHAHSLFFQDNLGKPVPEG